MGCRDSGWIQIYAENNQEVYDNYIQAMPIAEHCRLPIMICQDGFITSHAVENIELCEDEEVKSFVGEYEPEHYLLKENEPLAVGPYGVSPYYMEIKKAQAEAMKASRDRIYQVAAEFEKMTGRHYGMIETYRMEDAEYAVVLIGSSAGTAKEACSILREQGHKVGVVKVRVFRPFPWEELQKALSGLKAVAVMEKCEGFSGCGGPLFAETRAALYDCEERPRMVSFVYGLGGRDVTTNTFAAIYQDLAEGSDTQVYRHVGVRGDEDGIQA
jgi:pyruvate ferredoxin oxidoreductase alpha subunit